MKRQHIVLSIESLFLSNNDTLKSNRGKYNPIMRLALQLFDGVSELKAINKVRMLHNVVNYSDITWLIVKASTTYICSEKL